MNSTIRESRGDRQVGGDRNNERRSHRHFRLKPEATLTKATEIDSSEKKDEEVREDEVIREARRLCLLRRMERGSSSKVVQERRREVENEEGLGLVCDLEVMNIEGLRMMGFMTTLALELIFGGDRLPQIGLEKIQWFIIMASVFIAGFLISMFEGKRVKSKSKASITSVAEKLCGLFAMIGVVYFAILEYEKGTSFVSYVKRLSLGKC